MLCYNIVLLLLQFSLSVRIFFLNYILYEIEKNDNNNNNNNLLNQENKGHRSGIVWPDHESYTHYKTVYIHDGSIESQTRRSRDECDNDDWSICHGVPVATEETICV